MMAGVHYIKEHLPDTFYFENVKAVTYKKHYAFITNVMKHLESIKEEDGSFAYVVTAKVVNTKAIGGIAQNRPRWYCVGIRKTKQVRKFQWPKSIPANSIEKLLPPRDISRATQSLGDGMNNTNMKNLIKGVTKIEEMGGDPFTETWFIDLDSSNAYGSNVKKGLCPCLTRTRSANRGFYVTNRGSRLTTASMLRLQGHDPCRLKKPQTVSNRQFRATIGNAVSATVLCRIMRAQLIAVGLLDKAVADPVAERCK